MGSDEHLVTLEQVIAGVRTIRREWATIKAEKCGREVLAKLLRLTERAGMSLEEWFNFMDSSQGGKQAEKLTALELRQGFPRLVAHIAKRECRCRAYRCERTANHGFPPIEHTTTTKSNWTRNHRPQQTVVGESQGSWVAKDKQEGDGAHEEGNSMVSSSSSALKRRTDQRPSCASSARTEESGWVGEAGDERAPSDTGESKPSNAAEEALLEPGTAVACREHALEGMVHLGPR